MGLTRVPQEAKQRKSPPSAMPKALTFFHTIRDLRKAGCQVQIAPSHRAVSGFFLVR